MRNTIIGASIGGLITMLLLKCTTVPLEPIVKAPEACEMISETIKLYNQTVKLPALGHVVVESHIMAMEDDFPYGQYANTVTEKIATHLKLSCDELKKRGLNKKDDCSDFYDSSYVRQWTPAESGRIGQGSIGNLKPPISQEIWSANMYWTKEVKPSPGDKWLMQANGRAVVVSMGWESGPGSIEFIAGAQGEIHKILGTSNESKIMVGRLKNQSLSYGPVDCK